VKKAVNQLKSVSGKHFAKPWSICNSKSLLPVVLYMQGTHVVMKLLRESDLLGHHVFCDNFFTSLILARRLLTANTYLTGTMRKNRNLPRLISEANPGANQTVFSRSGRLLCCALKERQNRKTVRFVSTYMNTVHNQNEKPSIATTYNKFMGGVDMNDMMS
jgi:hypothetical protein